MRKRSRRTILKVSTDIIEIDKWLDTYFDYPDQVRPKGNPRRKKDRARIYKDVFSSFDIEVTNDPVSKQGFMYIWGFCLEGKYRIMGRTWDQFLYLVRSITARMGEKTYLVCHVHNLSYEWNWLKALDPENTSEVFAMDPRKIAKMTLYRVEFRCSYILTNLALKTFTKNMKVKHVKMSGERYDYSVQRTPGRSLRTQELNYLDHDIRGLCEALEVFYSIESDNHYTIPMTSTGFVRRDMKATIRSDIRYSYMKKWQLWENDGVTPSIKLMTVLHDSFRGGDTHGSRFYVGKIMRNEMGKDRVSSYPTEMINKPYPYRFKYMGPVSLKKFKEMVNDLGMAALVVIKCEGIELKDQFIPDPYISFSKIHYAEDYVLDNGRVMSCGSCVFSCNDIDLRIILHEYDIKKIKILDAWFATYKPLPQPIKDVILEYYRRKTELKNVPGMELLYQKSKEKLNACYGMTVYFMLKKELKWTGSDFIEESKYTDEELLRRYNNKGFIPYQVGCWVTSWARYELRRGMYIVNGGISGENFLYSDTDSIKYICSTHEPDFTSYNKEMRKLAKKNGSIFKDPSGKEQILGQFTDDGPTNEYFITLGAKKYCAENNGTIELTLAGVNKKKGARELEKKGGIRAFKPGTIFEESAGLKATYNDNPDIKEIRINGEVIKIIPNLYLENTTYTMSIGKTNDYKRIIELAARIWYDVKDDYFDYDYDVLELDW